MTPTEQIKERLSIVDVVSSYIKLEKAGRNLKARCPFHNEKTPSFMVSPERNSFHCFGCSKGGDIFTFVEEIEGVEFKEALRQLAERAGVTLVFQSPKEQGERKTLFTILEEAVLYFQSELHRSAPVQSYLDKRGLTQETIKEFRIGFAPPEWRSVSTYLLGKGYTENDLEKTGLIIRSQGKMYDRFRGRIMFPIADSTGKIVGFSGRIFTPPGSEEDKNTALRHSSTTLGASSSVQAKYINSPETPLYNKSKILYGFDKAKVAIRRENSAVLVEGQFDVIASHQAGVANAVAASGTALTDFHAALVRRLAEELILAYDADDAGLAAAGRGVETALLGGLTVKLAALPGGTDPADLAVKNPALWKKQIEEAKHVVDFYLDVLGEKSGDPRTFQKEVEARVLPFIVRMRSKIEQAHYVGVVAKALGLGEEPVWEEVRKREALMRGGGKTQAARGEARAETPYTNWRKNIEERIAGMIIFLETASVNGISTLKKEFETLAKRKTGEFGVEKILFEIEMRYSKKEDAKRELEELLTNLKRHILKTRLRKAMHDLKYAEGKGDEEAIAEKSREFHELAREMERLKSF